jgi:hypothetical protein
MAHSWQADEDAGYPGRPGRWRVKHCVREGCGLKAARYGHGTASYWGWLWPGHARESFETRVPACGQPPAPPAEASAAKGLEWMERIGRNTAL